MARSWAANVLVSMLVKLLSSRPHMWARLLAYKRLRAPAVDFYYPNQVPFLTKLPLPLSTFSRLHSSAIPAPISHFILWLSSAPFPRIRTPFELRCETPSTHGFSIGRSVLRDLQPLRTTQIRVQETCISSSRFFPPQST
ncbi:hypothetical protein P154DRAFT_526911 [Amniculicola lignicola CBS 123094]|uniref:Secreted protein n=1 Tax=Amniculicola lignicola CBS 123094 TaxID=1392246 RepID=A0A6A5W3B5_9PLEO|nr:hypothetical protein P154DRAFT_526911 [Amniculicola lignicola CBS 123094]